MGYLSAQILLTLATIAYGFIPMLADFNATHATNPIWPPHARFHVVWQVTGFAGIAVIGLWLIWFGESSPERLYLAAALGAASLLGFFTAMGSRRVYGGAMYDENGIQPFRPPLGPATWRWDANVTIFSAASALVIAGAIAV